VPTPEHQFILTPACPDTKGNVHAVSGLLFQAGCDIIEQDVQRLDHTPSADEFTAVGRDIERMVLARAVRWHVGHRVLLNRHTCVVFR
jgi:formyltetrahydrofolate hydrolase